MDLHKEMYLTCKASTPLSSQVICDVEGNVVKSKGKTIRAITVKFNVPKNCKVFNTKSRFFVKFGLYTRRRVAIPIWINHNFQRFTDLIKADWICKTYGLTSDGRIVAFLSKEQNIAGRCNIVSVNIDSKRFAVSALFPSGKVLKQLHYGAVAKSGHSSNYALFKCSRCGQVANSDRKASLAIAVKSPLVWNEYAPNQSIFFQLTNRPVPVNGLLRFGW
jgi:hypothetical protein